MVSKEDFTHDEWEELVFATVAVGNIIIHSDLNVLGAVAETSALVKTSLADPAPGPAGEMQRVLYQALREPGEIELPKGKGPEFVDALFVHVQAAGAAVDRVCTPEEAAGYKDFLASVALAVAEAHKDGGHFGIGGVLVSDKEKAALARIDETLGR